VFLFSKNQGIIEKRENELNIFQINFKFSFFFFAFANDCISYMRNLFNQKIKKIIVEEYRMEMMMKQKYIRGR